MDLKNKFILIAHRGYSALYPENTLVAFQKALDFGVDMIELDVHLTRDHEVVVHHDFKLGRTTRFHGAINKYDLEELKQISASGNFWNPLTLCIHYEEKIPSLRESLQVIKNQAYINIEIKKESLESRELQEAMCLQTLKILKSENLEERIIVSSTSLEILSLIRKLAPELKLALVDKSPHIKLKIKEALELKLFSYHPNFKKMTPESYQKLTENNLLVYPYTPTTKEHFHKIQSLGAHGVITNHLHRF